ncbi:MAG: hypothetical protein ACRBEQ_00885 [Hyphomonas sp.]
MKTALNWITAPPRDLFCFSFLLVICLVVFSIAAKNPLEIGEDLDDRMRLVQIAEYLSHGLWFDVGQSRLGLDGGIEMHWSRLVDLPILVLHWIFSFFVSDELALSLACAVWPVMSVGFVVWGISLGMGDLKGKYVRAFVLLIAFIVLYRHYRFMPGAIDHHNLQLGCLAIAMGATLRAHARLIYPAIAAVAVSVSVVIGAEVYALIAVLCAFYAFEWALYGNEVKRAVQVFGLVLLGSLIVLYPVFVAPTNYLSKACDALSSVPLFAFAMGGLGLAAMAQFAVGLSKLMRTCLILIFAAVCLIALGVYAPACLHDPLSDLSPTVRILWLGQIAEARPIYAASPDMLRQVGFSAGMTLTAIVVSSYRIWQGKRVRFHALCLALLLASAILTVVQSRFYVFGHIFAILPLGVWCGELFAKSREDDRGGIGYLLAVSVSTPLVWAVPGMIFGPPLPKPPVAVDGVMIETCEGEPAMAALNGLPEGRVLATPDIAPHLLQYTSHSVLTGNYHRNKDGIEAAIYIALSESAESEELLVDAGVNYVLFCPTVSNTKRLILETPDGLYARLAEKEAQPFLTLEASAEDGETWSIYRVLER